MTSGTTQRIDVATEPNGVATCSLSNEKGSWLLPQTPGAVTVDRAQGDLAVACSTIEGSTGAAALASGVAVAAFGNIVLVGSLVWAAVDVASGAAFAYPDSVTVVMIAPAVGGAALPPAAMTAVAPRQDGDASPHDVRSRLKLLREQRESKRITEAEYLLVTRQIVETVGWPRPMATTP